MHTPESVFIFDHFHVRADRMICDLRIADARFASLDAPGVAGTDLPRKLTRRFPDLPSHACVNDFGPTFGSCMAKASMPHLLEHLGVAGTDLPRKLTRRFPDLPSHACVNDFGPTFGSCMAKASMPHLLEHLVIALQAEAEAADPSVAAPLCFVGKTRWTDFARLTARVEVNYRDDITAFRAFRDAALFVDSIVLE